MADEKQSLDNGIVHYEGGIPVFNTRLNKLEDEAREAKSRDEEYKKQQLRLNKRLVWFTGILAFVGVVGGAISGYQAHVAKLTADAAGDNAAAAKGMVEEMKQARSQAGLDSANAISAQQQIAQTALTKSQENAQQALDVTVNASHLDQRPWVYPAKFGLSNEPDDKNPQFTVTISLINGGKTIALDLIPAMKPFVWGGEPPLTDFSKEPVTYVTRGVLPPGIPEDITSAPLAIAPGHFSAYKDKRTQAYIHARILYRDSFKTSLQHWTTVCAYHTYGEPLTTFHYCDKGNDVDREQQ